MKKICNKILSCAILALLILSTFSMFVPVRAAVIDSPVSPASYEQYNFSFKGTYGLASDFYGMFMDVTVRGTAANNNNETITLDVFINNRNVTKSYTFLTDGQNHVFKNIYLGLSGGSNVHFKFTGANPNVEIYMFMDAMS